jgi:uncharacterized protein (TIGR04255 family)
MIEHLPKKLNKEPIIEAVFEIRFTSDVPASNILPGLLFNKLEDVKPQKLPVSDIPQQIRDYDPALRYSPLFRIPWKNNALLIGDRMFAIANIAPYHGWENFKKIILEILDDIKQSKFMSKVERYSLKYVNLVEADSTKEQLDLVACGLQLGSRHIKDENINLRIEMPQENLMQIVQIITNGEFANESAQKKKGIFIIVDAIVNEAKENFWEKLPEKLEKLHDVDKLLFFDCLKETTVKSLEPIYDK